MRPSQIARNFLVMSLFFAISAKLFLSPQAFAQGGGPENFIPPANMESEVPSPQPPQNINTNTKARGAVQPVQAPPRNQGVALPENPSFNQMPQDEFQQQQIQPQGSAEIPQMSGTPRPIARPFNFDNPGVRYDPSAKRDVFYFRSLTDLYRKNEAIPLVAPTPGNTNPLPRELSEDPLLNADLTGFEVLGILWEVEKPRAIIRDPKGQIHTIYKGTKIGIKGGAVAAIREGEIVVIEYWEEDDKIVKKPRLMIIKDRVR